MVHPRTIAAVNRSMRYVFRPLIGLCVLLGAASARAADGYWLDQYNAIFYLASFQLDHQLVAMRQAGGQVVMVHADSLPGPVLRWMAWRSRLAGLQPVAWIQRPSSSNLLRRSALQAFAALQVDDHYFANPPLPISRLRAQMGSQQLWCSFQPSQYSWQAAQHCDHVDVQVYRQDCQATVDMARQLGIASRRDTAIAVYHDGSPAADRQLSCTQDRFAAIGNRVFVFKWNNPEHWLTPITRCLWQTFSRLRTS